MGMVEEIRPEANGSEAEACEPQASKVMGRLRPGVAVQGPGPLNRNSLEVGGVEDSAWGYVVISFRGFRSNGGRVYKGTARGRFLRGCIAVR